MLKVRWDRFGVIISPAYPWPPCQGLEDVTDLDASRILLDVCREVLQRRATWEVDEDTIAGGVRVKVSVTEEHARTIAEEFRRRCEALAAERARIAAALGNPRQPPSEPQPEEPEPAWPKELSVEEEAARFREEIDRMLRR